VIIVIGNYYFSIFNLLTKWPFQPEATGDGDGAPTIPNIKGEPLRVQDIIECHGQAESPQKDDEVDAIIERAEVRGSEF
jgi:hypothetical protein